MPDTASGPSCPPVGIFPLGAPNTAESVPTPVRGILGTLMGLVCGRTTAACLHHRCRLVVYTSESVLLVN